MNAVRTLSGEKNRRLFMKAEFVVWTEGGSVDLAVDQILEGYGTVETNDVYFWQRIFDKFGPGGHYYIKSVGSKSTLVSLADLIDEGLENVFICMDRDYDFIDNAQIDSKWAIYTYGYSWENDIITPDCIHSMLTMFCTENEEMRSAAGEAQYEFECVVDVLFRLVAIDFELNSAGYDFLPKQNPSQIFMIRKRRKPKLNRYRVKQFIREAKYKVNRPFWVKKRRLRKPHDISGKMLIKFIYHLILYVCSKFRGKIHIDEDSFIRQLVFLRFHDQTAPDDEIWCFYRTQFSRLSTPTST